MNTHTLKKTIRTILLSMIFLYFIMPTETLYAKENHIIRVGYPIVKGFTEQQNGIYTGYVYDYLREIAIYTGWEYEFVEMDLATSMNALRNGDIDLLAGMFKNEKTMEIYDFPEQSIGSTYTTLSTLNENDYFDSSNPILLDGMKVGYYETAETSLNHFMDFCKDNEIKDMHLIPYPYSEKGSTLVQKLHDKEVDAILAGDLSIDSAEKIIAKFGATPHYFATTKGKTEVIKELDKAILKIRDRNPDFEYILYNKYFQHNQYSHLILSKEQQNYINNMEPLRAVYINNYIPLQYYDKDKKEPKGIFVDAVRLLSKKSGIPFEFIPAETYAEAYQMIKSQKADVIIGAADDYLIADQHDFTLTRHYLKLELAKAVNKNKINQKDKEIIATLIGHGPIELSGEYEIYYYNTFEECLNAVDQGIATAAYGNTYSLPNYVAKGYYNNLTIIPTTQEISISLGLSKSLGENLTKIIHKVLYYLSDQEMIELINKNTLHIKHPISLKKFFYTNMTLCLSVIGIILSLISIIIYMVIKTLFEKTQLDPLTGLNNREACERLVTQYLSTKNVSRYSAFIIMDMDYFKQINDRFGHKTGDNLLIEFGTVLKELFSKKAIVSRLGGDEFIVLIKDIDESSIDKVSERLHELCQTMHKEIEHGGDYQEISLSIGAIITNKVVEFNKLYTMADEILYEVKRNGRNGFKVKLY